MNLLGFIRSGDSDDEKRSVLPSSSSISKKRRVGNHILVNVPHEDKRWRHPIMAAIISQEIQKTVLRKNSWKKFFFILNADGNLWTFTKRKNKKPRHRKPLLVSRCSFRRTNYELNEIHLSSVEIKLRFDSKRVMFDWIEKFMYLGATREDDIPPISPTLSEYKKIGYDPALSQDICNWKRNELSKWINLVGNVTPTDEIKNLTGKDINEGKWDLSSIENLEMKEAIEKSLNWIKGEKIVNFGEICLYKKISRMLSPKNSTPLIDIKSSEWGNLVRSLNSPALYARNYMSKREEFNGTISKEIPIIELQGLSSEFPYVPSVDNLFDIEIPKLKKIQTFHGDCFLKKKVFRLPIRIMLGEFQNRLNPTTVHLFDGKIRLPFEVSPDMKLQFSFPEKIMLTPALMLGPFFFTWGKDSLAIAKSSILNDKTYSFFKESDTHKNIILKGRGSYEHVFGRVSEVIERYNTCFEYGNEYQKEKNSRKRGFIDFVKDIFNILEVDFFWPFTENIFNQIMGKGESTMEFVPSKKFQKHFKLKDNSYEFSNHEELNKFVEEVAEVDEIGFEMEKEFITEHITLKCFDRCFHVREIARNIQQSDCFFGCL